jgi:hypothetical protein
VSKFLKLSKHILIIPYCRVLQYELSGAKISLVGARGELHVLPEALPLSTELHARNI